MKNTHDVSILKVVFSYWSRIRRYKKSLLFLGISIPVFVLLEFVTPYLLREIINQLTSVTEETRGMVGAKVEYYIWVMLGVSVLYSVIRRSFDLVNTRFQSSVFKDLSDHAFHYLHQHGYTFFQNTFGGSLVKKVTRYVSAFEGITDQCVYFFFPVVLRLAVALWMLFSVNLSFGIGMLVWLVFFLTVIYVLSRYKSKFDYRESVESTKVSGVLADTIANNVNVKLFSSLKREQEYFEQQTDRLKRAQRTSWNWSTINATVQNIFLIVIEIGMLFLFLYFWRRELLTAGDMVLLVSLNRVLLPHLWELGNNIRKVYKEAANAMEMLEVYETPHEVQDKKGAKTLRVKKAGIEMQEVRFSYTEGKNVFENFSLTIAPGEKVALVGKSGSGKSTITKLLLRFEDIHGGQILIGGKDTRAITQDSLRETIAMIPQEPILFHRSLKENIAYGKPHATQKEIEKAAKLAHAHDFIMSFPEQYDTFVGERGVKLSGGERQRVAIARAILKNAPIIILDEATSSLDSESEKLIQDALHTLFQDKTAIVIAHRLSTIMEMDRIIVLSEGKIVEQGTHAELLKKRGSTYKKLWDIQSGGFLAE